MANQVSTVTAIGGTAVAKLISLPGWLTSLSASLATVNLAGQSAKKYLPAGLILTTEQRGAIETKCAHIQQALDATGQHKEKLAMVAKLLLSYPMAGAGEMAGQSRAEAFTAALDDVPAWVVADAVRKWHRGECGEFNYQFAPAPAVLRSACLKIIEPVRRSLDALRDLLDAKPLLELMDHAPAKSEKVVRGFRDLSMSLGSIVDKAKPPLDVEAIRTAGIADRPQPEPESAEQR